MELVELNSHSPIRIYLAKAVCLCAAAAAAGKEQVSGQTVDLSVCQPVEWKPLCKCGAWLTVRSASVSLDLPDGQASHQQTDFRLYISLDLQHSLIPGLQL